FAGMTIEDVDVMELNEAFAAQVLPVCRDVGVDPFSDKLNPHGGAIALGHPYGMTGARIMNTLLNDLETLDRSIGLETMCVGGGAGGDRSSRGGPGAGGRRARLAGGTARLVACPVAGGGARGRGGGRARALRVLPRAWEPRGRRALGARRRAGRLAGPAARP